jgi:amino acid transporter
MGELPVTIETVPIEASPAASGLRHNSLSPLETLSQSVSAIAPTTSPAFTIPLVFALCGNGTWLAYLIACGGTLLIALCIARFASDSASPGSLYKYATDSLPPMAGRATGWALLFAYVATGSSVVGGFINYARVLMPAVAGHVVPGAVWALVAVVVATAIAYHDVQASAQLMLWIEAASVLSIAVVVAILLFRNGLHVDWPQAHLVGVSAKGVRLGTVLALFSFVGFESATTLGHEARNPLRTIPRAVVQSALLAGVFFISAAYVETLGFAQVHQNLGVSTAPFRVLSALVGISWLGPLIDVGACISMFACVLACIIAGARVLLRMAQDGLAHASLSRAHSKHETPHFAVVLVGLLILLPAAGLALRGYSGADVYAWTGSLAVYGFITAYGLVAAALPFYLRRKGHLTAGAIALSAAGVIAMIAALAGTLYPVPEAPYNWLPYVYLVYLAAGLGWSWMSTRTGAGTNA